jgi:hypothetical protein
MSISLISKINSIDWINFFSQDFAFASLIASNNVFLSKGILKPHANEGLEPNYKNIRLLLFVFTNEYSINALYLFYAQLKERFAIQVFIFYFAVCSFFERFLLILKMATIMTKLFATLLISF